MSITTIEYLVSTNEDWRDTLTLESGDPLAPVDLTGSSFVAHLRTPAEALHVALSCSTSNGLIEIVGDPADGTIAWSVPVAVLETIEPGKYAYDIVWTNASGVIDRFVAGIVTVERGVTRA